MIEWLIGHSISWLIDWLVNRLISCRSIDWLIWLHLVARIFIPRQVLALSIYYSMKHKFSSLPWYVGHNSRKALRFTCKQCSEIFATRRLLKAHVAAHSNEIRRMRRQQRKNAESVMNGSEELNEEQPEGPFSLSMLVRLIDWLIKL